MKKLTFITRRQYGTHTVQGYELPNTYGLEIGMYRPGVAHTAL